MLIYLWAYTSKILKGEGGGGQNTDQFQRWGSGEIGKTQSKRGYVSNAKEIVSKKIHGSPASHVGFQMSSYLKALNNLINNGVSYIECYN